MVGCIPPSGFRLGSGVVVGASPGGPTRSPWVLRLPGAARIVGALVPAHCGGCRECVWDAPPDDGAPSARMSVVLYPCLSYPIDLALLAGLHMSVRGVGAVGLFGPDRPVLFVAYSENADPPRTRGHGGSCCFWFT